MKKRAFLNVACSSLSQIVSILCGLVVPRLILNTFGSEANGLISSLTQFLNYIALVEGGIGSVVLSALYGPLARKDNLGISQVLKAANRFFKQIAYIFVAYTLVLACVYPLVIQSSYSWLFVSSLTVILSLSLFIQYFFSITYRLLLQADQKMYIVQLWQIIISILNLVVVLIVIRFFPELHMVKLCSVLLFLIQPIAYGSYVKKHYQITMDVTPDQHALSQRWAGFGQNLAYFVHSNTDIIILSFFCDLKTVSVYSVYTLVIKHLQSFFKSFSHAFHPILGKDIAMQDEKKVLCHLDIYELIVISVSTIIFGCCIYLMPSFALLYTNGVSDTNYYRPIFAVIIIMAEYVCCVREPYVAIVSGAGKFKETANSAYAEAGINIVLSVLLVRKFGLEGIAVGTFIGMFYRMLYLVFYINRNIVKCSIWKPLKRWIISVATIILSVNCVCYLDITGSSTVLLWLKNAFICVFVFSGFTVLSMVLFEQRSVKKLILAMRTKEIK